MPLTRSATYPDGSTPSVCIVGTGFAGLCAAIQLKRQLGHTNLVIFDKAHDVGGVWLANTYPGCQTDIPAIAYSYSFAQNPKWSQMCPERDEMWAYIKNTATKYGIYPHTQFGTSVESIRWDEASKIWNVTTRDVKTKEEKTHEFNVVVLGTGPTSSPFNPPEFESFSGPKMHSAEWNDNIKLENQVVGVVGTGASAVQIIPNIAPKVKKLIVYMREPNYVYPKVQISFGRITKLVWTILPCLLWVLRGLIFLGVELTIGAFETGTLRQRFVTLVGLMPLRQVKDEDLRKRLTPRYRAGFKLPAIAYSSYYETYNRPNVELNESPVSRTEGQNIVTEDGRVERLDALILCTGFKILDFFYPLRVTGARGIDLVKLWKSHSAETFYGITCAETPNLFFLLGPNGGAGNILFMIERQAIFVVNAVRELTKRNAASICVRKSAVAECMCEIREAEKKMVYMQAGPPGVSPTWLQNEHGHCVVWPKSCTCYWLRTRRIDPTKFEFTSRTDGKTVESVKYRPASIEDVV